MKSKTLTEQLLRDRAERKAGNVRLPGAEPTMPCFQCGKPFVYRGPRGDNSGRFCSDACCIEYDVPGAFTFDPFKVTRWRVIAGGDPGYLVATPMTRVSGRKRDDGEIRGGFRVGCRCCGKQFESLGLAYCPACMKLPTRERMRPGRPCAAPGCSGFVPIRRPGGKRVRADAKYCAHHSTGGNLVKVGRPGKCPKDGHTPKIPQQGQSVKNALIGPCDSPIGALPARRRRP
jgi:hypothetical protein